MKFSDQDAQDITKVFRDASKAAGDYLYAEWGNLAPADSGRLGQMYVTLKNTMAFLPTRAVGIDIDEGRVSLAELSNVVAGTVGVFQNIDDANKAIVIVTALIDLAAAIPTGNMEAIVTAFQKLQEASST